MRRIQSKRCTLTTNKGEIKFDSIAEKNFYLDLLKIEGLRIIRPCELNLPGRVRKWKCDFGLIAKSQKDSVRLTRLVLSMNGLSNDTGEWSKYLRGEKELIDCAYLEFKGVTDLKTGLTLIDANFKNRIDWLAKYADHILDRTIVVGNGTGGIVSYCGEEDFRVTPVHSKEFFVRTVRELW